MLLKKRLVLAATLFAAATLPLASQDSTSVRIAVQSVKEAGAPRFLERRVLLSYPAQRGVRMVGARFEYERWQVFHPYFRNENGVFLLLLDVPEGLKTLTYRVAVDGLWTFDPNAAQTPPDDYGVIFSTFSLEGRPLPFLTSPEIRSDGQVTFRYRGQRGRFVSLIGDFNDWDPYWQPMEEQEASPGLYQVTVRLSPGPHYYVFSVDGDRVIDALNVELARDSEGFQVSKLVVPGEDEGHPAATALAPKAGAGTARTRLAGFIPH
jgi:hypothetical protein